MKKIYEIPTAKILCFGDDIITTSVGDKRWDLPLISEVSPVGKLDMDQGVEGSEE